jgi:excisionase family DNA binding protein
MASAKTSGRRRSDRAADDSPAVESYEFLTFAEVARRLGPSFTKRWVRRQVEDGRLGSKKLRGRRVVPAAELHRFVTEADTE